MLEGVTIEQLRTLRAVADAGNFSAAARKLGRVQAAVSQAIDRLEAQLGLRLFDRSGRVPRLTRHGEAIADAAAKVEDRFNALEEVVLRLKEGEETSLAIVVDAMFPTASWVAFAKDFAREYPEVELVLFTDVLSAVTEHVRAKQAAFGIAIEDADFDALDRRPIAKVRLVPVAAKDHPLAKIDGAIDTGALADRVQIVLGQHHGATSELQGVFSKRTWRVVDLATKHAMIGGGLGWGHLPEHLVRQDLRSGDLVELHLASWGGTAPTRELMLATRPNAVLGPIAKWAQKHLVKLCQKEVAHAK